MNFYILSQVTCAVESIPSKTSVTITTVRANGIRTFRIRMTRACVKVTFIRIWKITFTSEKIDFRFVI
jgi:hypothetical protein